MRLFIIICRGSTSTNIKRVLTEPYAVVTSSCSTASMPTPSSATTTNAMSPNDDLMPSGCRAGKISAAIEDAMGEDNMPC